MSRPDKATYMRTKVQALGINAGLKIDSELHGFTFLPFKSHAKVKQREHTRV